MTGGARLVFVGDISLGGDYAERCSERSLDWTDPFIDVLPIFQDADLRIGNLEDPLHRSRFPRRKRNLLGAPPESAAALSYLEFTAMNLGNNHITDQGSEGIAKTREVLEARGITPFGAGRDLETAQRPALNRAGDLVFAFLGYAVEGHDVGAEAATDSSEGCVPFALERIEQDVVRARREATHVVVSVHWGYQYDRYPDPEQILAAHQIIDFGALIVHGHHPHVLQGIERYKRGLILYSLGNFFFPDFERTDGRQTRLPSESSRTAVVACDVGASGVQSYTSVPVAVGHDYRMRVLRGRAARKATRSLLGLSKALGSPDYDSLWRSHHSRTERKRFRRDERSEIQGDAARLFRQARKHGLLASLRSLRGRHVREMLSLVLRLARLLRTVSFSRI